MRFRLSLSGRLSVTSILARGKGALTATLLDFNQTAYLAALDRAHEGAGYQPEETLRLMMLVDADFAVSRANTEVARFLVELLKCVPCEIVTQLGDDAEDLRPRWVNGTAKMLARTHAQHVTDLNRRGDAIGDRLG